VIGLRRTQWDNHPELQRNHFKVIHEEIKAREKRTRTTWLHRVMNRVHRFAGSFLELDRAATDDEVASSIITNQVLCIHTEASELLEKMDWKHWHKKGSIDRINAKEEAIDLLHFVFNVCAALGMTAEEIKKLYLLKNDKNFERQYLGRDDNHLHDLT